MQMAPKALIKFQESADSQRRDQKRNRQSGRVTREKKNSLADGVARRRNSQHARKDRSDARCPPKRKRKSHQKPAGRAWLPPQIPEMDVPIEPARKRRTKQKNK